MRKRIALWALIGAVVVCFWTLARMIFPQYNIGHWPVVAMSVPVALIGRTIPLTYYEVAILNAATYALLGFAVEPFVRRHRQPH